MQGLGALFVKCGMGEYGMCVGVSVGVWGCAIQKQLEEQ
jgi:hypothetical protein